MQLFIIDFKVLVGDIGWNEETLIDQCREGLSDDFWNKLASQGISATLDEVYQRCIVIDSQLEELKQTWGVRGRGGYGLTHIDFCPLSAMAPVPEERKPVQIGAIRRLVASEERQSNFLSFNPSSVTLISPGSLCTRLTDASDAIVRAVLLQTTKVGVRDLWLCSFLSCSIGHGSAASSLCCNFAISDF